MTELIANEDVQFKFTNSAGPPDIAYTGDVGQDPVSVVVVLCSKVKAEGKQVATTSATIVWGPGMCPHSSATHTHIAGGGAIVATAAKVTTCGVPPLREGDAGTCAGTWQPPGEPPPPPIDCACSVEVSSAGQTTVKGA